MDSVSTFKNKQTNKRNNEFEREGDGGRIEEEVKLDEMDRLNWRIDFIKTLYVCIILNKNILLKITQKTKIN